MNPYLRHPVHPNWHAHSSHVKAMLGLDSKAKLPAEGLPPQVIQGIKVWVAPLVRSDGSRRKFHRVRAECPLCGKEMSAGRLHQHKCKKTKLDHYPFLDILAGYKHLIKE